MKFFPALQSAALVAALACTLPAQADSFASSASSAGSASSGSVSDSLSGSSKSSSDDDKKTANGDYRIIDVAEAPARAGFARVTLQAEAGAAADQRLVLDLPQAIVKQQALGRGDRVHAQQRAYGFEFARSENTREPFYLVLADDWYGELSARQVRL
jgi:hypothetical protein